MTNIDDIEIFLVLTAEEKYWDTDKDLVFLGPWCLVHDRRGYWESLHGDVMASTFSDQSDLQNAYDYVDDVYENVLPIIAKAMNVIHGSDYSLRFWRIVLGSWLHDYIGIVYDRYMHIKKAFECYPFFSTYMLSEKSYVTPTNTLDFTCRVMEDGYNFQLYSKILKHLGSDFSTVDGNQLEQCKLYSRLAASSWKHRFMGIVTKAYVWLTDKCYPVKVVFRSTYLPLAAEAHIFKALGCRLLLVKDRDAEFPMIKDNHEKRSVIQSFSFDGGDFESCLSAMLFEDIPQSFVESFEKRKASALSKYPKTTKVIFSANSWYYDELFKLWAANQAEQGAVLLGTPHGGNYGALLQMSSVQHEMTIVDKYYSWGWKYDDCSAKVLPMPASKLLHIQEMEADNRLERIFWVATTFPRYLCQFPFAPVLFKEYMSMQASFLKSLPENLMYDICLRAHCQDDGWGVIPNLHKHNKYLQLDSWDRPFRESLKQCRLYVCDHLSTTFIEALAANKPTILFWDDTRNVLRADAEPYFAALREQGILFHCPEAAAQAVAKVYDDVESWWLDDDRQQAVKMFCDEFALTSSNGIELWAEELKHIVKTVESGDLKAL